MSCAKQVYLHDYALYEQDEASNSSRWRRVKPIRTKTLCCIECLGYSLGLQASNELNVVLLVVYVDLFY